MNSKLINLFIQLNNNAIDLLDFFVDNGANVKNCNFDTQGGYYGVIANGLGNTSVNVYSYEELDKLAKTNTSFDVNIVSLEYAKKLVKPIKSFPRVMWVKDEKESVDKYVKRIVICYILGKYIVMSKFQSFKEMEEYKNYDKYITMSYDEAIELEELTVLTKEDIAKLANTTTDKLKII